MPKVKIAIIDNGVDETRLNYNMKSNICINPNGRCILDNQNLSNMNFMHGTICAAIIQNHFPDSEIYSLRILDENGKGEIECLEPALEWCLESGISVVNLSLGTTHFKDKTGIRKIINHYANQGICIIAATSNSKYVTYPASFSNVLGVAIRDKPYNEMMVKTKLGLDVLSPVEQELVIWGKNIVIQRSNSYATPFVTALVGKLFSEEICHNIVEAKCLLKKYYKEGIELIYESYEPDWICNAQIRNVTKKSKTSYYFNVVKESDKNEYDTIIINDLSSIESVIALNKHIVYLGEQNFEREFGDRFFWSPYKRVQTIKCCCSCSMDMEVPIILCESDNNVDEIFLLTELREAFSEKGYNFYAASLDAESVLYELEYIPIECLRERDIIRNFLSCEIHYKQSDGIMLGIKKGNICKQNELPFEIDVKIQIDKVEIISRLSVMDKDRRLLYKECTDISKMLIKEIADKVTYALTEEEDGE